MDPTKVSIDRVECRAEAAVAEDDYPIPIKIDFNTIEAETETISVNTDRLAAITATRIDTKRRTANTEEAVKNRPALSKVIMEITKMDNCRVQIEFGRHRQ